MQPRLLSFSEIQMAMTCQASWDFAYGGRLAGSTLKPKMLMPILSDGRAWGAAVAAWHQGSGTLLASWDAHKALRASLRANAAEMMAAGFPPSADSQLDTEVRLGAILDHYMATADLLPNLTKLEGEIIVGVPSRGGKNRSSRYRFQCFLDGFTDLEGQQWIVEFKLRGGLTPVSLVDRQRQPRWYAWAHGSKTGIAPTGVFVDERLNEAPKEPRTVQGKKKGEGRAPSHAKDQLCTPDAYVDLCHEHDQEPHLEIVEHLRQRLWQQRVPLLFRAGEMEAAGAELRDSAKLICDLDSGALTPIRNATRAHCQGCRFREICSEPGDSFFVETLFDRGQAKRDRLPK